MQYLEMLVRHLLFMAGALFGDIGVSLFVASATILWHGGIKSDRHNVTVRTALAYLQPGGLDRGLAHRSRV